MILSAVARFIRNGCFILAGFLWAVGAQAQITITTSSLPDGTTGNSYSEYVSASNGSEPYSWSVYSGSLPDGLSLNTSSGNISGSPSYSGTSYFTIEVTDSAYNTAQANLQITVNDPPPLTITTGSLSDGETGAYYSQQFTATGGSGTYTWSDSSTLPGWLSLSGDTISGTPTTAGTYTFSIYVSDDGGMTWTGSPDNFSITVNDPPPPPSLTITTSSLPDGTSGSSYSAGVSASYGTEPYYWSVASGSLPDGLSLDTASGNISGTPSYSGTSYFTIQVTDASYNSALANLQITINDPPPPPPPDPPPPPPDPVTSVSVGDLRVDSADYTSVTISWSVSVSVPSGSWCFDWSNWVWVWYGYWMPGGADSNSVVWSWDGGSGWCSASYDGSRASATLTGLSPGCSYNVTVSSASTVYGGSGSAEGTLSTTALISSGVTVSLHNDDPTQADVSWDVSSVNPTGNTHTVYWGNSSATASEDENGHVTATITGLSFSTNYSVWVQSVTPDNVTQNTQNNPITVTTPAAISIADVLVITGDDGQSATVWFRAAMPYGGTFTNGSVSTGGVSWGSESPDTNGFVSVETDILSIGTSYNLHLEAHGVGPDSSVVSSSDDSQTFTTPGWGIISFTNVPSAVTEGESATVTVLREGGAVGQVSVGWTGDGQALVPNPTGGTLTFAQGETNKLIQLQVSDDFAITNRGTINLTLNNPTGGASLVSGNTNASISVTDNELPGAFQFRSEDVSREVRAGKSITITVNRTGGSVGQATVHWSASNGSAFTGSVSGTLTFADSTTSQTLTLQTVDNVLTNSSQTVELTLSNPTDGASVVDPSVAVLTIQQAALHFDAPTYWVPAGDGSATIRVIRNDDISAQFGVHYATSDGTAINGVHYTATSGTLVFLPGETEKTFSVPITCAVHGGNKTVNLALTNPDTGDPLGEQCTATLVIVNAPVISNVSINQQQAASGFWPVNRVTITWHVSSDDGSSVREHQVWDNEGHLLAIGMEDGAHDVTVTFDLEISETRSVWLKSVINSQSASDNNGGSFYTVTGPPLTTLNLVGWSLLVSSHDGNSVLLYDAFNSQFLSNFISSGTNGLYSARGLALSTNGVLYVVSSYSNQVLSYDATTGQFLGGFAPFVTSLCEDVSWAGGETPTDLRWGPDGALYISGAWTARIARYDTATSTLNDNFIADLDHLAYVNDFTFGPDGDVYVINREPAPNYQGQATSFNNVLHYDGTTGAFEGIFVETGSGGLDYPVGLTFGPDGNLYVSSSDYSQSGHDKVLRYNGATGEFIDEFVTDGSGGLARGGELEFGPGGNLYVEDYDSASVKCYDGTTGAFLYDVVAAGSGGLNTPGDAQFITSTNAEVPVISSLVFSTQPGESTNEVSVSWSVSPVDPTKHAHIVLTSGNQWLAAGIEDTNGVVTAQFALMAGERRLVGVQSWSAVGAATSGYYTVEGPPLVTINNLLLTPLGYTNMLVTWNVGSHGQSLASNLVTYWQGNTTNSVVADFYPAAGQAIVCLTNLLLGSNYSFLVFSDTGLDTNVTVAAFAVTNSTFKPWPFLITGTPTNSAIHVGTRSTTLTWAIQNNTGSVVHNYVAYTWSNGTASGSGAASSYTAPGGSIASITIGNLQSGATYNFNGQSVVDGQNPNDPLYAGTNYGAFSTADLPLPAIAITNVSSILISDTAALVAWNVDPANVSQAAYHYVLYDTNSWFAPSSAMITEGFDDSNGQVIALIDGLQPQQNYSFCVQSVIDGTAGNYATADNLGNGYSLIATNTTPTATFTNLLAPDILILTSPTNLVADTMALVMWDAASLAPELDSHFVVWNTDSPPSPGNFVIASGSEDDMGQVATLITGLLPGRTNYYYIQSALAFTNSIYATDDNGGQYYSFVTLTNPDASVTNAIAQVLSNSQKPGNNTVASRRAAGKALTGTHLLSGLADLNANQTLSATNNPLANTNGVPNFMAWTTNNVASGTVIVRKSYDAEGRLTSLVSNDSSLTYTYDAAGQLTSETQTTTGRGAKSVGYSYDPDGNRTSVRYPDGSTVSYAYDSRNQMTAIGQNGLTVASYSYDGNGRVTAKALGNGIGTSYTYDDAGRLTNVVSSVATLHYGYNAAGNRTSYSRSDSRTETYGYDSLDQITSVIYGTSATNTSYGYDWVGNRTSVTYTPSPTTNGLTSASYTVNSLNQYTQITTNGQVLAATYDTRGNLTSYNGSGYFYDGFNRFVAATNSTGGVGFAYDALNRCVSRTVNGVTTYFYWDGWDLIEERDANDAQVARYVHGAGTDEIISRTTPSSTAYYHHDGLGNVTHLTDASANVVEKYAYDVFGQPTILSPTNSVRAASIVGNRFMFTGREYLVELGIYDYRNRMYSPVLGRFLQTDPIGFEAGDVNLYRYCGNSAVNETDPSGESPWGAAFKAAGRFSAGMAAGMVAVEMLKKGIDAVIDKAFDPITHTCPMTPSEAQANVDEREAYKARWHAGIEFGSVLFPGGAVKAGIKKAVQAGGSIIAKLGARVAATKPSLSAYKKALGQVHAEMGRLPKGKPGKFGSPQAGDSQKGYRLDPPHPDAPPGSPEAGPHFNWWDYTGGKRGHGGRSGAVPVND